MPTLPISEYAARLGRLQALLAEAAIDVFVVWAQDSILYLTGAVHEPLERPFFLLVGREGSPSLVVPELEREHMRDAHNVRGEDIEAYWDYPAPPGRGWPEVLRRRLGSARRVGVEPSAPQEVVQRLDGFEVITLPLIERLRLMKSTAEVAMIRQAARYADRGVAMLLASSYDGATVAEGAMRRSSLELAIIREVEGWDPVTSRILMATWAAPRSAMPHAIPKLDDRIGGDGPHVALVLTRINGYAAECERTYFTAPPRPEAREAFDTMMEARRRAFAMIRPGLRCAELDAATNAFLKQEGHAAHLLHRTGHGFGLGNHEGPWVAEGSEDVLAEGMVISVEPGIYLPGLGGIRHSDTVLVTARGHELLTRAPMDYASLLLTGWNAPARLRGVGVRALLGLRRGSDRGNSARR